MLFSIKYKYIDIYLQIEPNNKAIAKVFWIIRFKLRYILFVCLFVCACTICMYVCKCIKAAVHNKFYMFEYV